MIGLKVAWGANAGLLSVSSYSSMSLCASSRASSMLVGKRLDYIEPSGAVLPKAEALLPMSTKSSRDFEALSAVWFRQ
ncbi:hypothetical protein LMG26411_00406 [Cupriavidus numazuensis]|uniref:Secreted protein n=1 Tax=Cupriavidus numazuensis TaxID=221992 RepID=A0ABM8TAK5_9BURK|nr:hypothetical protein LMG26411_00406 [Cupriavidus numazuensis]